MSLEIRVNRKVVYMCREEFKNGKVREWPLTEKGVMGGFLSCHLLKTKLSGPKIQRNIVFKEKGVFLSGQAEKRGPFGVAQSEKWGLYHGHSCTGLIWQYQNPLPPPPPPLPGRQYMPQPELSINCRQSKGCSKKKNIGVFDGTLFLAQMPIGFNYFVAPPPIRSNCSSVLPHKYM